MNGYNYYGLSINPFDKHSFPAKDYFRSRDFTETLSRLNFLKDSKGIGLITAQPGMGKSFAIRCFADSLNPNVFQMVYVCLSTVSVTEFYKQLCLVLGLPDTGGKTKMFASVKEQILSLYKDKQQPLILAIDEAQYLNASILNDIKMLMNYSFDSLNCFTLILSGEQYLNAILCKPVHEALRQRISIHYDFNGLSPEETADYIYHKIGRADGSRTIIDTSAINAVTSYVRGNPRLIDNIMSDAIMLGAQMDRKTIDVLLYLVLLIIILIAVVTAKLFWPLMETSDSVIRGGKYQC